MKILIVDDNTVDRDILLKLINTIGDFTPDIVQAEKLSEAFKILGTEKFDLVILDLFLPESKGLDTLRRMVKKAPDLPVVALTRFEDKASGIEAVREGAQDYLVKGEIDDKLLHHVLRYATEKKKADLKIKQYARQLELRNEEYKRFAYVVSHDLRAPLRAMQGFADALLEDYGEVLDETGREYAERVVKASLRMDELINDLLVYSRITSTDIELGTISSQGCLDKVLESLEEMLTERKTTIELTSSLPSVIGHSSTLVQILANLITNSLKFVQSEVTPKIKIGAEGSGIYHRIWVEDNGIGIDPAQHEKIFAVFERLHGTDEYPGTGIGLAIVKKGVERQEGKCGVESAPGRGSKFWIDLKRG